jgi:membrane protein DedA with SNARE-associated domain/rhodanese-related sulfurtransferase
LSRRNLTGTILGVRSPFGLSLVFLNVLLDQLGLPVPAVPTLVVAGAMAAAGRLSAPDLCALAVGACVLGDSAWYAAGRVYGGRVLRLLCRISLSPDSCVAQTQSGFERWGAKVLLVAKFVPGLSIIAPPLAGATRMAWPRFLVYSLLGSILWVGAALAAGALLRDEIVALLPRAVHLGGIAVVLVLALLGAYLGWKSWERWRFYTALDMARIGVSELQQLLAGEPVPVIVDVRSPTAQLVELRRIPGALHVPARAVAQHLASLPRDRDIILYCNCPNEASAAEAARTLMKLGYRRVRPLRGGLDAWIEAGYAVETFAAPVAAAPVASAAPPAVQPTP